MVANSPAGNPPHGAATGRAGASVVAPTPLRGGAFARLACLAAGQLTLIATIALPLPVLAEDPSAQRALPSAGIVDVRLRPDARRIVGTDGGIVGWGYDLAAPWPEGVRDEVRAGFPLMRSHVQLDAFRDRPLDDAVLARIDAGLRAVREAGGKVIPRFTYNNPSTSFLGGTGWIPDAPLDLVLTHIRQLAPVLERNRDVIAWFEAGFVGAWGEWHSSRHRLDRDDAKAQVRDALLAAFPADRQILFRYPDDVQRWYPQGRSASAARIGIHNDCFMSDESDGNTFPVKPMHRASLGPQALRDFTSRWNRDTAFGGETCQFKPKRTACRDILAEGPRFGLTYLNRFGTLETFAESWRAEGCHDTVINSIGARIELLRVRHPAQASAGQAIDLEVALRNTGWSRIPNPRRLELVLEPTTGGDPVQLVTAIDSQAWLPGEVATQRATVRLPRTLPAGTWRVALASPDAAPSLAGDPRYGLQFANADDAASGQRRDEAAARFYIGSTIRVVAPGRAGSGARQPASKR